VYFHNSGPAADRDYQHYLTSTASAVDAFRKQRNVFVILVATERLDARPANKISEKLGGVPVLTSDHYNMYELVSILCSCHMMASSRYHGIVTSMPSLVPSAGITMDERIRNLMQERGHEDLLMTVDEPDLETRLLEAMETLRTDGDLVREGIGRTVVNNLKRMARMGVFLEQNVRERYPEFPVAGGVRSWEEYLPPLNPALVKLVETYESRAQVAGVS
jgi:polysaccharide pyruvyl transferase WcaK-like protein